MAAGWPRNGVDETPEKMVHGGMGKVDGGAIARAFELLLGTSWPDVSVDAELAALAAGASGDLRSRSEALFAAVQARYPGTHLWVKDEHSHFLAACPLIVAASGLDADTLFSGINDHDPRIAWSRQGPLYVRDDYEVFSSNTAKLDIVERQDREDGVVWLKTSKAPFRNADGKTGGTVGAFEVISAKEAVELSRKRR